MKWFSKKQTKKVNEEELKVTETVVVEEPAEKVVEAPVEAPIQMPAEAPVEEPFLSVDIPVMEAKSDKIFIVNCNKCGASLKVKDGAYAYICGKKE